MGGKVLELESDKLIEQGLELGRLENQMATAVKMLQVGKYTIKEIADQLGVSATTVSNVLNGRAGKMSQETRQRVEEALAP